MFIDTSNKIKDHECKSINIMQSKDCVFEDGINFEIKKIKRGIVISFSLQRNFHLVLNGTQILLIPKGDKIFEEIETELVLPNKMSEILPNKINEISPNEILPNEINKILPNNINKETINEINYLNIIQKSDTGIQPGTRLGKHMYTFEQVKAIMDYQKNR